MRFPSVVRFVCAMFLLPALIVPCSFSPSSASQQNGMEEQKRAFPIVRNPYSWMAQLQRRSVPIGTVLDDNASAGDEQTPSDLLFEESPFKRSPSSGVHRRPQNPYSWMSFGDADHSHMDWLLTRLRPFSDLVSKRLNALNMGMALRRPQHPYLWAMNRQMVVE